MSCYVSPTGPISPEANTKIISGFSGLGYQYYSLSHRYIDNPTSHYSSKLLLNNDKSKLVVLNSNTGRYTAADNSVITLPTAKSLGDYAPVECTDNSIIFWYSDRGNSFSGVVTNPTSTSGDWQLEMNVEILPYSGNSFSSCVTQTLSWTVNRSYINAGAASSGIGYICPIAHRNNTSYFMLFFANSATSPTVGSWILCKSVYDPQSQRLGTPVILDHYISTSSQPVYYPYVSGIGGMSNYAGCMPWIFNSNMIYLAIAHTQSDTTYIHPVRFNLDSETLQVGTGQLNWNGYLFAVERYSLGIGKGDDFLYNGQNCTLVVNSSTFGISTTAHTVTYTDVGSISWPTVTYTSTANIIAKSSYTAPTTSSSGWIAIVSSSNEVTITTSNGKVTTANLTPGFLQGFSTMEYV